MTDWDDADANLAAVIATQDAVILGRRSHDEWAANWPGGEIDLDGLPAIRCDPIESTTSPTGHLLLGCRVLPA